MALTETICIALPPMPVQDSVNVVLPSMGPTASEPAGLRAPDQPPLAWQVSASVDDQVRLVVPPLGTDESALESETDGAGTTVTLVLSLALPPLPVQVSEKLVLLVIPPTDCVPLGPKVPLQPPPAVH
jgi:hypothetical protein